MKNGIPSLDLADFTSRTIGRRQDFVRSLGKAYEEIGFVAIENHLLGEELVEGLYRQVKAFFALPGEVKKRYEFPSMAYQRGYASFGQEHARGRNRGDLKEFWQFGQEVAGDDLLAKIYPANVEVSELPEFNACGMEAFRQLEKTGKYVLRALALYIGLDEEHFDAYVDKGNSILRPIHYPPLTGDPDDALRSAEHEDINLITLLMGASAGGLQVLSRKGKWMDVHTSPDQIVVNVGDMLQRLTNDKMRSTTHRVVNPPREEWGTSRHSIPFFLHPRPEMSLNCLPECIGEGHPRKYADITAGDYLEERLREIGLKSND